MTTEWKKLTVDKFNVQATPRFPDGAPQREEYDSDEAHEHACRVYAEEWRLVYRCRGCKDFLCPQCSKE